MSGGSFDYLYSKTPGQVLDSEDLDRMGYQLEEMGHDAKKAYEATRELIHQREVIAQQIAALGPVWRAVEWWQSADWGQAKVWKAIGEWEAAQR